MRRFLFRLFVAIVVFGLVCVFLITTGAWPRVVEAVDVAFGRDTAQKVDEFGQGSKDIADKAMDTYEDIKDGAIDFSAVGDLLDELKSTATSQRIPDYDRALFGVDAWADVDHNGCDTRNDILARDLTNITKDGTCIVLTGTLADPYTGETISFVRGAKTSTAVHIDHIFALSASWSAGSYAWTTEQREQLANDPLNLLAVDGPTNSGKSDKGPAEWMPPNAGYACQYVAQYVAVAAKYDLAITAADRDAIERTLVTCT